MKKTKLIVGAILLCATIGAYASSTNLRLIQSYYVDGSVCRQFEEVSCITGDIGCEFETPAGLKQLYASQTPAAGLPCSNPLQPEN